MTGKRDSLFLSSLSSVGLRLVLYCSPQTAFVEETILVFKTCFVQCGMRPHACRDCTLDIYETTVVDSHVPKTLLVVKETPVHE